jgi:hypothetical protein
MKTQYFIAIFLLAVVHAQAVFDDHPVVTISCGALSRNTVIVRSETTVTWTDIPLNANKTGVYELDGAAAASPNKENGISSKAGDLSFSHTFTCGGTQESFYFRCGKAISNSIPNGQVFTLITAFSTACSPGVSTAAPRAPTTTLASGPTTAAQATTPTTTTVVRNANGSNRLSYVGAIVGTILILLVI